MSDPTPPDVPEERLDANGWERADVSSDTIVSLPTARVDGATVVYERADGDDVDRFFFATRLRLAPAPITNSLAAAALPTVVSGARSSFRDRLRDRGFGAVDYGGSQSFRGAVGGRGRLLDFEARGPEGRDVHGWLAAWPVERQFRLAGGAYPAGDASARSELLALLRDVE